MAEFLGRLGQARAELLDDHHVPLTRVDLLQSLRGGAMLKHRIIDRTLDATEEPHGGRVALAYMSYYRFRRTTLFL